MAKTLVIKGADFSTNKVTTVTFGDVPCTGITLSESSYTITDMDTVEIEYTLTPTNTTDTITWESSDTSVATVAGGVITPVGIGTCTITATCGTQTATATVVVAIEYIEAYYGGGKSTLVTTLDPNIITTGLSSYRFTAGGSGSQATEYLTQNTGSWDTPIPCIKLPGNTVKIRISVNPAKCSMFDNNNCTVIWAKDESAGNTTFPNAIKPISSAEYNLKTTATHTINVPTGADSVVISPCFDAAQQDFDAAIAETEFKIEFLAE